MNNKTIYKIRVIRGAFTNPKILDDLDAKTIENVDRDEWISIDEVEIGMEEIKRLQKSMTRHYDDTDIPWYMDGYERDNKDKLILAFGADDGEGGKIFTLDKSDAKAIEEAVKYGVSKGIPARQMEFYEIDF